MTEYCFIGVDIAKDKFDVALEINGKIQNYVFENNANGFNKLLDCLKTLPHQPWVVMEATGYYGDMLAVFLCDHVINTSVVNPTCILHFAKSKLTRNKLDALDARVIRKYALQADLRLFSPKTMAQIEIRDLVRTLDLLKNQSVQLKNQLSATRTKPAIQTLKSSLKLFSKQMAKIEAKLKELVASDKHFDSLSQLLKTIPGIADMTTYRLLGYLPDLTAFKDVRAFAAYIGVTPMQRQSGKWVGETRLCKLGHGKLRKALYMPALSAKRHNKALKPFVDRLTEKGLKPKAIVAAVMRKLAHMIFGVLKSGQPYDPKLI